MFTLLYIALAVLLIAQLAYPFLSALAHQLLGREHLPRTKGHSSLNTPTLQHPNHSNYACIITAYKNATIAKPLVHSLLQQRYPHFHIYLVADECPEVALGITHEQLSFLKPDPPLRLKAKSILYAIERFQQPHNYIAIFDADNLAHPDFLSEIDRYAQAGHVCIQGQRTAKNLDTTYAALDSMGEHYKNYLERYLPYRLGSSSVISGSGMATEAGLYKAYLASPEIEQGKHQWKKMLQEDKILQNFILRKNLKIAYARQAVVYDEKVETGQAVETQRSRWLFSYFQNLPNSLDLMRRGILSLSWNQFYFGFITAALPMFLQVAVGGALFLLGLLINPVWALVLLAALFLFALSVPLLLWLDGAPAPIWQALVKVPLFVGRQFLGLFKMRNPNKNFKHTEHRKLVSVEDVMKKD